ncbi:MAG: AraC family transcriptional regulator [Paludibacteraceae bacterium]|nr:AraC family transcriptional regulator [Paludibacteraceae bacterium]
MQNSTQHTLWYNYKSEVIFGVVMVVIVALSTYLSRFIPDDVYDNVLTPVFNVCTCTVAFVGMWFIFRHSEQMRIRRLWGWALLMWGLGDLAYLACYLIAPMQLMNIGAEHITVYELLFGNLLGWVMVLYPTETLRPGWLTWKVVLWQLLPMMALVALDYLVPFSLWPVIALYPYALLILVLTHIREYRRWCEDNFSTLDNIDVQWIIRYCIMLAIIGINYVYLCSAQAHTRGFTQQWFVILMLVYSTEQIMYRKDPWKRLKENPTSHSDSGLTSHSDSDSTGTKSAVLKLEAWLEQEKPYLNPDFQLSDLRQVLPLNRTYLSQLINAEYGCSFYQWVNGLRIREAKRLMTEQPELKVQDIAERCGFSSAGVFSRVFTRETGIAPSKWGQKSNNS